MSARSPPNLRRKESQPQNSTPQKAEEKFKVNHTDFYNRQCVIVIRDVRIGLQVWACEQNVIIPKLLRIIGLRYEKNSMTLKTVAQ